jgi:hypothetical protein
VIGNRDPEKIESDSIGALLNSAPSALERLNSAKVTKPDANALSFGFGTALSLATPEKQTTNEVKQQDPEDEMEESTTPQSSPEKLALPRVVSAPSVVEKVQIPTTPAPTAPSSSAAAAGLGIGRPSTMPARLSVPTNTSSFSSAPTRRSPLASTPPVNRSDISDSPPKPTRLGGGIFSKKTETPDEDAEGDDDDEYEKFMQSRAKPTQKPHTDAAKNNLAAPQLSVPAQDTSRRSSSLRTPSPSPPATSVPISDSPKTIPRVKTPPLQGMGFGFGNSKKSSTASQPPFSPAPSAFADAKFDGSKLGGKIGKPTTPASNPLPSIQSPVPQKPAMPSFTPPQGSFLGSVSSVPSPKAPAPSIISAPRDDKPTINGSVDRIIYIMDKELDQVC